MSDSEFHSVEQILKKLDDDDYDRVSKVLYGSGISNLELSGAAADAASDNNFELQSYRIVCNAEQVRPARIVRIGLFQHKTPLDTWTPIPRMRDAFYALARNALDTAHAAQVNVFCFQETWNMPFAFCTREKQPWCEYAESAEHGPTTKFLQDIASQYNMVIISPILERNEEHSDTMWNAAVVIDNHGQYLGKHRKNHIPRVGDFNESTYYMEGNTGHPVFETEFGRLAINICYGRHHPVNWMMFGLNGAEIVFNPSATVGSLSEPLWGIEARNAAIANGYYACAINRVGTEVFRHEFTSGDGKPAHTDFGHFYGSSYVAAPNGGRTPGLSRTENGLLVTELDLNLCRQVRDHWGFQMTQRLPLYVESFTKAAQLDFRPQIIKK